MVNGPKSAGKILGRQRRQKYDEILRQQEDLNRHINEQGAEEYQRLFVHEKKRMGPGSWFMICLIIVAVFALIISLPINWASLYPPS